MDPRSSRSRLRRRAVTAFSFRLATYALPLVLASFLVAVPARAATEQWSTHGPNGGPASAVAITSTSTPTVYAGTSAGGLFSSTDGGSRWLPADRGLPPTQVDAIVVDPTNPSTLYAGMDNLNNAMGGVFKTNDGGATWAAANNGIRDTYVICLVADPAQPSTLYAGTETDRVYKTTGGGARSVEMSNGLPVLQYLLKSLVVDPSDDQTVYAATDGGGVFKTTAGAATWHSVNVGLSELDVLSLAIDPSSPATLYAGT